VMSFPPTRIFSRAHICWELGVWSIGSIGAGAAATP
jgi:hypothetical protein